MEIIRHLSDDELAILMLASDQQALRETLEGLPASARTASQRPDEFWEEQRAKVWSRVTQAERTIAQRFPVLTWVAVASIITVGIFMLHREPAPQIRQTQFDPDHELLIEVERAMRSDGPEALEPAALLAQEMIQAQPRTNMPIHKKELTHEN
jgi:flagellar biosynthesis regulator FlaF